MDIAPDGAGNVYFSEGSVTTLTLFDANGAPFPTTSWTALQVGLHGEVYASTRTQVFKVVVQGTQGALTGTVTVVAGRRNNAGVTDGDALTQADLSNVYALSLDAAGNLYTGENYFGGGYVRQITPAGQVRTLAGGSFRGRQQDGVGAAVGIAGGSRGGLAVGTDGVAYVVDSGYLRKIETVKAPGTSASN